MPALSSSLLLLSTSLASLSFDACDCQDCCCFVVPDSKCSNPTTKHVIGLSKAGKALFLPLFSILASCVFPSSCCPSPLCFLLPCRARSSDLCRSNQIDTPQTTAATTERTKQTKSSPGIAPPPSQQEQVQVIIVIGNTTIGNFINLVIIIIIFFFFFFFFWSTDMESVWCQCLTG